VFALALVVSTSAMAPATAQDSYPNRPLRAISVSGAGGAGDVMQRLIVEQLAKALGQPVVIDYRPGANGIIGASAAAKADPDGYTLFISNVGAIAVNKALYTKLPYDPERDFAPVSMVVTSPLFLITNTNVPVANVRDVIALAKKDPKSMTLGYPGSTGMLTGSNFLQLAGIDLLQVPYKTVPSTMLDLIADRIQLYFAASANTVPQVMGGKVRALAVTTTTRSHVLPDVPTMEEAGVPGFSSDFWFGFFVPAGTPPEIITRLNREIVKVLQLPEVRERLMAQGDFVIGSTPEAFRDKIRDDIAKYREIMRKGNIPQIDNN
jgi:tripartite-type tricarboxylate transporter receptor subunit TctC